MISKRILNFLEFLKETNLNLKTLSKPSKDNRFRGDILVDKIKDHEELFTKIGDEEKQIIIKNDNEIIDGITDNSGRYDADGAELFFKQGNRYDDVIEGEDLSGDEKLYKLNDLEKTEDFGSSGGSSLGTKNTRIIECIQCLYLSLKQDKKTILTRTNFYNEVISQQQGRNSCVKLPMEITQDILDVFYSDWIITWIKTANALFSVRKLPSIGRLDSILNPRKKYKFYQIGYKEGLIGAINRKYKQFEPNINISKWSPSDIWAVSILKEDEIIRRINTSLSIVELNWWIDYYFNKKLLIGISLKKLNSTNDVPDIIINKETPVPIYEFDSIKLPTDPFASIGLNILSKKISSIYGDGIETLKVSSSSGPNSLGNINFEVVGKTARHGKISLDHVNDILVSLNLRKIKTAVELEEMDENELNEKIIELNTLITQEYGTNTYSRSYTITRARLISKYQSLLFAKTLKDNSNFFSEDIEEYTISDILMQKILYFAMSIENPHFSSPKYARFI